MNQAQQVVESIRNGSTITQALAAAPIKEWGRFEGITSYYMEDGSRVWRGYQESAVHAAPAGAPREANVRPYPQPF